MAAMTLKQLVEQATAAMEFLGEDSEVLVAHSYRQESDVLGEIDMKVALDPTARGMKMGTLILKAVRLPG